MPSAQTKKPSTSGESGETDTGTERCYDLAIAENWCIREDLIQVLEESLKGKLTSSHFSYNKNVMGEPGLLRALVQFFNDYFDPVMEVKPEHIAIGPGASSCLGELVKALCQPGDCLLVPTPYWNGFDFHLDTGTSASIVPVTFKSFDASFSATSTIEALEAAFRASTQVVRAIVITNPHNPLGFCYSKTDLLSFARFCQQFDIHMICDEVYALSHFGKDNSEDAAGFCSALSLDLDLIGCQRSRVHVVWSMSKDLGCSGLRMGCTVTQDNNRIHHKLCIASCLQLSNLSMLAATSILTSPKLPHLLETSRVRVRERYGIFQHFLDSRSIEYIPATSGIYVMVRLLPRAESLEQELKLAEQLEASGVRVATGSSYHVGRHSFGWYRIVFSVDLNLLRDALARLGSILDRISAEDKTGYEGRPSHTTKKRSFAEDDIESRRSTKRPRRSDTMATIVESSRPTLMAKVVSDSVDISN